MTSTLVFTLATHAPVLNASESVSGQTSQTSVAFTAAATSEAVGTDAIAGVELFDGPADLGAAVLTGGQYTFTAQKLLPGAHSFTVTATDLAGNVASIALPQVVVNVSKLTSPYILSAVTFTGTGVTDIRPNGINDLGELVGSYVDGRADDIGADGRTYFDHGFSSAINATGRLYTSIDNPDAPTEVLNGQAPSSDRTRAFSVNAKGDIVGYYAQHETGTSSAGTSYVLPDAGFIDATNWPSTFGKLAFSALNDAGSRALGINSGDQIVGYYTDGSGNSHGFMRSFTGYGNRGNYTSFDIANSISTVAESINDSGKVAGFYQTSNGAYHGFLYDTVAGTYIPIDFNGATSTQAFGVNNYGAVVGIYTDSAGARHGFVRSSSGQLTTIDNPNAGAGGTLVGGINDAGEIVGWYSGTDGHDHGFTGIAKAPLLDDFDGNGKSDLVLQNDGGSIVVETTNGLAVSGGGLINNPGPTWHVVGSADFNGDGQTTSCCRTTTAPSSTTSWTAPRPPAAISSPTPAQAGMSVAPATSTPTATPTSCCRTTTAPLSWNSRTDPRSPAASRSATPARAGPSRASPTSTGTGSLTCCCKTPTAPWSTSS